MTVSLDGAYRLSDRVALRPEPFGALAYHYVTRRLVFLRSIDMVNVVNGLGTHSDVAGALAAADIEPRRWPAVLAALASLEASEVICAR